MTQAETPRSNRLHIAIYGRRNAGKSSLINAITGQSIALVSEFPGTTTDPVYKSMELLPIGPVVFVDTAGLDDEGELGELRIRKTKEVMEKTDLALVVVSAGQTELSMEQEWIRALTERQIPVIGVINKIDEAKANPASVSQALKIPFVPVSATELTNIAQLKNSITNEALKNAQNDTLLEGLVYPKDTVVLVMPQDRQAPKGRLILPQMQVVREILDRHAMALAVSDAELEDVLLKLNGKPDLIITDSQVFGKVNRIVPAEVPLTSFSIIMARNKGDLNAFVQGAKAIDTLKPGDRVLIAEACTHHALKGDIGREKLPAWLEQRAGGKLDITVMAGVDFPEDLSGFKLIVHCGSCMFNRKQMLSRIRRADNEQVPITNYGIAIAHLNGILERVMSAFNREGFA